MGVDLLFSRGDDLVYEYRRGKRNRIQIILGGTPVKGCFFCRTKLRDEFDAQ
jgi:hypothetical protein